MYLLFINLDLPNQELRKLSLKFTADARSGNGAPQVNQSSKILKKHVGMAEHQWTSSHSYWRIPSLDLYSPIQLERHIYGHYANDMAGYAASAKWPAATEPGVALLQIRPCLISGTVEGTELQGK